MRFVDKNSMQRGQRKRCPKCWLRSMSNSSIFGSNIFYLTLALLEKKYDKALATLLALF